VGVVSTRGSLEIVDEAVIVEVPRGRDGNEVLRVTFTQARADGKDVSWHSLRVFWRDDKGEWRPGKQGLTIRSRELEAVREALSKEPSASSARGGFAVSSSGTAAVGLQ
jgi:hypothetical protein